MLCTLVYAGQLNTVSWRLGQVGASEWISGVSRTLLLRLGREVGVGDVEVAVTAELEEALSILIHLSNEVVTQTGWSGAVVCTNSFAENEQRLLWRHITDTNGRAHRRTCPLLLTGRSM